MGIRFCFEAQDCHRCIVISPELRAISAKARVALAKP
jgi:hypothetical protein